MDNMFVWFNQNLGGTIGSIIGAILIVIIGAVIAMMCSGFVRGLLARINLNQRMNTSTGKAYDVENIVGKIVFWFIFLIAISGALSMLNLNAISAPFANMIDSVLSSIPTIIYATIIGVVGWVVATVARTAINTALAKTTLDERLSAEAGVKPLSGTIADMVYWVILLFVLVMVLGQLKLDGLFAPLTNMLNKAVSYVPNIFMAAIVFFVGFIVAKIVRGIVTSMVASLNLQKFADKTGITSTRENSLPNLAGSIAFFFIIVPVIITALHALKVEVITRPATNMLNDIMLAVPRIFGAVAIMVITYFVMKMVANVVKGLLANTRINSLPAKVGFESAMGNTTVSDLAGYAIVFFGLLIASTFAVELLQFEQIGLLIAMFIDFAANVILGAVILLVGFWLANIIAGVVERSDQGSQFLANIVRVLIMGLVLAMGLKAMGIADSIVNLAFGLTLGSVAVAFALSFGLGGQEAAARFLRKMQDKIEVENAKAKVEKSKSAIEEATGNESPSIQTLSGDKPTVIGSENTSSFDSDNLK